MREVRLGDDVDDYCVRCKRIMNHAVVSVMNAKPAKVRCRTCHSDHDYRNEQAPPPKVDLRKQALFHEVLKKVDPDETVPAEILDEPLVEEAAAGAEGVAEGVSEIAEAGLEKPKAKAAKAAKGRKK
jgi:hypothetical protein